MNKIFSFAMLAGVVCLTACSSDDIVKDDLREIKLAVDVAGSRAFTAIDVPAGSVFYVWADQYIDKQDDPAEISPFLKAWKLTATGDAQGNLQTLSPKTFPSQNNLIFYVMKGNFVDNCIINNADMTTKEVLTENVNLFPAQMVMPAGTDPLQVGIEHQLIADQRTENTRAFAQSDLVYGEAWGEDGKGVPPAYEAIRLQGYHMLSQFEVVLHPGYKADSLTLVGENTELTITNMLTTALLTPDTLKKHKIYGTNNDEAFDITNAVHRGQIIHPMGSATAIQMDKVVSTDFNRANLKPGKVIVVPQTVPAGTAIITLTLDANDQDKRHSIVYKLPADFTFKSGYKYRFNLTINDGHEIILDPTYVAPNNDYESQDIHDSDSDGWAEVNISKVLEEATEQQEIELDPSSVDWNEENRDLYMQ